MPTFRRFVVPGIASGFALAAFAAGAPLSAQEPVERPPAASESNRATRTEVREVVIEEIPETEEPADVDARRAAMEEIIVIAPRPGERRLDEFDDPVRTKLLKDFYRMQELEEESKWREAGAKDTSSRIRVGYDPRDDYRMRNEMALQDLSWEKTKPATIFRIEF